MTRPVLSALFALSLAAPALAASINAGDRAATAEKPFEARTIAEFDTPWAIALMPDRRMLVTEKPGGLFIVTPEGQKTAVRDLPTVAAAGQNGMLDVALSPGYERDRLIYLTYVAPDKGGSSLVLSRAKLEEGEGGARLEGLQELFRQKPGGRGQPGGIIAFDPEGQHLFLTVGDRMEPETAQAPDQARGKVFRLTLDGQPAPGNPEAAQGGIRAMTWTTGHRNPYGLAFAPDGRLWLHEMGPKGGDEFNLLKPGKNYGWPVVSNGDQYSGEPIPRHETRPDFQAPPLYWNPVIAPAGLAFYRGTLFPGWQGSALIGGLAGNCLVRVAFDAAGEPDEAERFDMEARIRDVAVDGDGAVYVIEDDQPGRLLRLAPHGK